MAVQLSSGVGESVARASNLVKPKRTKLQIQQERDQKEQAARAYLSNQTKASNVVEALRDGTFDPEKGATAGQFKQWLCALKPVDVKKLGEAAGVKVSGTVGGKKVDPVAELVAWFNRGGRTLRELADAHFDARNADAWYDIAADAGYSAAELKDACKAAALKVGGSKEELIDRLARYLAGEVLDTDKERGVKKAKTTERTAAERKAWAMEAVRAANPNATAEQLAAAEAVYDRCEAKAKADAAKKRAAAKLPTVFA